jgi:hypothetical protein
VVPNLYISIAYQPFCLGDSFTIVTANHLTTSYKVIVGSDGICAILEQDPAGDAGLAGGGVDD